MSLILLNTRNKLVHCYMTYFLPSDYYKTSNALIFSRDDMYNRFISSANIRARLLPSNCVTPSTKEIFA